VVDRLILARGSANLAKPLKQPVEISIRLRLAPHGQPFTIQRAQISLGNLRQAQLQRVTPARI
jgi:hypothetical protein